jgi:hypothetical protein
VELGHVMIRLVLRECLPANAPHCMSILIGAAVDMVILYIIND